MHIFDVFLLFIVGSLTKIAHGLAIRDIDSDIASTKGGILVKNGKQTSCELGVIDSTSAFVSAPCLDFLNGVVDSNTTYEVYLDAGINNKSAKYTVESITVHPEYNSTFYLNPIAILQFNKESIETWSNPIAIDRNDSWSDVLFVRRSVNNMDTMEWTTPFKLTTNYSNVAKCEYTIGNYILQSPSKDLASYNQNDYLCSNATTYPPYTYLSGCAVPYGSVEVYLSSKPYVAGIYVYTYVSTNFKCTLYDGQHSNYVLFADYIAFASQVLGRQIGYCPNTNGIKPQSNPSYKMNQPVITSYTKAYKDGDFYANQTEKLQNDNIPTVTNDDTSQIQISSGIEEDDTTSTILLYSESVVLSSVGIVLEASLDPSTGNNGFYSESSGLSLKSKIIIGVICGIIGGLLLTGALIIIYLRWKKAHKNVYRNHRPGSNVHSLLIMDPASTRTSFSIRLPPAPIQKPRITINTAVRASLSAKSPSIYTGSSGPSILNYFKLPLRKIKTPIPSLKEPSTPDSQI